MTSYDEEVMLKSILEYKAEQRLTARLPPRPLPLKRLPRPIQPPESVTAAQIAQRLNVKLALRRLRFRRKTHRLCRECGDPLAPADITGCEQCKKRHRKIANQYKRRLRDASTAAFSNAA